MNYKTVNVMGTEVPVFETEDGEECYYVRNTDGNGLDFQKVEGGLAHGSIVSRGTIWRPKKGERVLFNDNGAVSIGAYLQDEEATKIRVHDAIFYAEDLLIAKYDPSKPVPETWAEVEQSGEVLEVWLQKNI